MRVHELSPALSCSPLVATLLLAPPALAARGFSIRRHRGRGHLEQRGAVGQGEARAASTRSRSRATASSRRKAPQSVARARRATTTPFRSGSSGLRPNKRYLFRFVGRRGKRSDVGTFKTAPKPQAERHDQVRAGAATRTSTPSPARPSRTGTTAACCARMKAERNDFNVMLGDTIYSDSEVPGRLNPIALSVKQKWAKYKVNLGNRNLQALRGSAGFYSHWDDHEFVNDFSPAENSFDNDVNVNGRTLYNRGAAGVPRLRAGAAGRKRNGLYRTVPLGPEPRGVLPRPALVPQRQRGREPRLRQPADRAARTWRRPRRRPRATCSRSSTPSLAQPVSQACLDTIRSPNRTYLGKRQLEPLPEGRSRARRPASR